MDLHPINHIPLLNSLIGYGILRIIPNWSSQAENELFIFNRFIGSAILVNNSTELIEIEIISDFISRLPSTGRVVEDISCIVQLDCNTAMHFLKVKDIHIEVRFINHQQDINKWVFYEHGYDVYTLPNKDNYIPHQPER